MNAKKIDDDRVVITVSGKDITYIKKGDDVQVVAKEQGFFSKRDFGISKSLAKKMLFPKKKRRSKTPQSSLF